MTRPGHDPLTNLRRLVACSTPRQRAAAVVFAANVVGLLVLPYAAFLWILAANGAGWLVALLGMYREARAEVARLEAENNTHAATNAALIAEVQRYRPRLAAVPPVSDDDWFGQLYDENGGHRA